MYGWSTQYAVNRDRPMFSLVDGALPFGAGALTVAGWFIFFDALLLKVDGPPIETTHYVPGTVGTVALVLAMCAPYRALSRDDGGFGGVSSAKQCARLWLFFVMLASLTSLYAAGGLATLIRTPANYRFGRSAEPSHQWLGSALLGQTTALAAATSLWVLRRVHVHAEAAF